MGLTNFGSIVSNGQLLGSLGVGNVYHVVQTGQSYYSDFAAHRQGFYSDGSPILHTTIASALTATVADRNDYVIVYADTDDYDVGATTTLANASTHLINPAGMGAEYGCIRTATIDPAGAYHGVTITGRATELAGFWIRGYTEKYCIVSTGLGAFIHHNDCAVTCTTSAAGGIQVGAAGMQTRVERNFIFSNAGSGTWVFGISVSPSATRTKVEKNEIMVSNASTLTVGIDTTTLGTVMGGAMMTVTDNRILEQPAITGTGASTLTAGIRTGLAVLATRNLVGIATTANAFIGGTANVTLIDNRISTDGGKAGV